MYTVSCNMHPVSRGNILYPVFCINYPRNNYILFFVIFIQLSVSLKWLWYLYLLFHYLYPISMRENYWIHCCLWNVHSLWFDPVGYQLAGVLKYNFDLVKPGFSRYSINITQEPLNRFAPNFDWGRLGRTSVISIAKFKKYQLNLFRQSWVPKLVLYSCSLFNICSISVLSLLYKL